MMQNPWLPFGIRAEAGVRLLCLPHAGAGASVYRTWGAGLPPEVVGCPVQPPGRERRHREEPFTHVKPLVKELAQEIADAVAGPFALLGHSTGALCAFETVRELRLIGGPQPVHLFVSGRRAPQVPLVRHDLARMSLPELSDHLRQLGGTPEEVLRDHHMLAVLQPLLAADFAVNECYEYVPEPPLNVPITAFAGVADSDADPAAMAGWESQTARQFRLHALDGGHFAVFEHAPEVHAIIAAALAGAADGERGRT